MSHAPFAPPLVPAEIPARLAARAIDVLLLVAIDVGIGKQIGFGYDWLIAAASIVLLYFALSDALFGATPGKLALGLRVAGPDGRRPSWQQAFRRESFTLLGAIPLLGPLLALGAWIWILLTIRSSPSRQGGHDLMAGGTRVVRRQS